MTGNGSNTYQWDAENRLIQVNYPGTSNNSKFTYDALGNLVKIVETAAGTITSTKQFVVCGSQKCEARDATSAITSKYYPLGQTISGTILFYTRTHIGSITDVTNTAGVIQAQYVYDAYGKLDKTQGSQSSDFEYAGYYYHIPSGFNLTTNRAYNAYLGRWINRDPIEETGGVNLYGYVGNNPISQTDPSGLAALCMPKWPWPFLSKFIAGLPNIFPTGKPNNPEDTPSPKSKFPWIGPDDGDDDDDNPPPDPKEKTGWIPNFEESGSGGGGGGGGRDRSNRPPNNVRQNKSFDDAVKEIEKKLGRNLTKDQQQRLHHAITGQNYTYWDIIDEGTSMFK
jgi:RHS repeat-associated protein